jgi:hypothetical protein
MIQGVSFDWTLRFGDILTLLAFAGAGIWWIWGVQGNAKSALKIAREFKASGETQAAQAKEANEELKLSIGALGDKLDAFATKETLERVVDEFERKLERYLTRDEFQESEKRAIREQGRIEGELKDVRARNHDLNNLVQRFIGEFHALAKDRREAT